MTELASRYIAIRATTERLAAPLGAEDCALQSMPDASPVKWHLAHTSWFFETFVLESAVPGYRPFDREFRVLFNSYYNTVGSQHPRPERGLLSRPRLDEVMAYRRHVDEAMSRLLKSSDGLAPDTAAIIELGLQHEQQHQELILTDVKHLFSLNPLRPAYMEAGVEPASAQRTGPSGSAAGSPAAKIEWADFEAGTRWIGHEGAGFAFDNESPRHRAFVEAFALATRPVTNGAYLAFMEDKGYERPELWLSDGWDAVVGRGWRAPLYWERRDGPWTIMTLAGVRDLLADEPVCHVSLYEADAYARWVGARLPTEEEWESAAAAAPLEGNFAEGGLLHPSPAAGKEVAGSPLQLFGDVWEWTRSSYQPYPGYRPPAGPLGEYNGKFMCNQLVLRGGSCATPRTHMRASYRNFFPPPARWQFSGIRLARDAS